MCAHRALERCGLADIGVAAVPALPYLLLLAGKDLVVFQVFGQRTVALLVLLLDLCHHGEQCCDLREALFFGLLSHAGVHLGPLVVLTACCHVQTSQGIGDRAAAQQLEPDLCVLLLIAGGLLKDRGQLLVAFFFCHAGKEGVLVACLALACKRFHQIFLGFGTLQFHDALLSKTDLLSGSTDPGSIIQPGGNFFACGSGSEQSIPYFLMEIKNDSYLF